MHQQQLPDNPGKPRATLTVLVGQNISQTHYSFVEQSMAQMASPSREDSFTLLIITPA